MANFSSSPSWGNARSFSCDWPSRNRPANDGSCDRNVAVQVLDYFDIPYIGNPPTRGNLCGFDINNMPATDAIQLSLMENLADGRLIELYTNPDGFAYFQEVFPAYDTADIEIRTCIPTSNIDSKVDLVIVRGYDTPPCRSFKDFVSVDWLETDSLSFYVPYCKMYATEAWRSYKDPVLETSYKDGVENLYELKAFESIAGYVIDFDGPSDPNIKVSFSNTTLKNVPLGLGVGFAGSSHVCDESGETDTHYSGFTNRLSNYMAMDKFGEPWPLLLGVQGVYALIHNISNVMVGPYGDSIFSGSSSVSNKTLYLVERKAKFVSLPASNWHWELNSDSSADVSIYSRTPIITDTNYGLTGYPGLYMYSDEVHVPPRSIEGFGGIVMPNMGGSWMSLITRLWACVELDRPSAHVADPNGNAVEIINKLNISWQPIVITDEPAPVAYTFGGAASLVDHTLDLWDSDPSTVQDPPQDLEGSLAWLQTQTSGRTIDVSLPFCDEDDCLQLASTIFSLQDENITTYNMVCGPIKSPRLGTKVPGYEGRINRISHSYTDSSAYNINITVGPTFTNGKGWSSGLYQRQTEDVSRQAVVVWSAGDGVNYRVRVQGGMGVYHAINKTMGAYNPGEKVSVTIHNNPKEK